MIGVFTYQIPHRKTYDTLCQLKARGIGGQVAVFAEPLHYQKSFRPLIEHRPKIYGSLPGPQEMCENFGYQYFEGFQEGVLPENSIILICGAGIVPQERIEKYRILNSHPGYLPNVRGLDALKWAIYDGRPIGVTTHQLGDLVDAGLIIERKLVPIYFNDTFHAVAQRQYEMEVSMLVDAVEKVGSAHEFVQPGDFPLHKRMPHEKETRLLQRFEELVRQVEMD